MVTFDDLRMFADKKNILVECHVKEYDAFENIYIKSVKIEYYKNRGLPGVPGNHAITMYENKNDDKNVKFVRASLSVNALDANKFGTDKFDGGLFYVTVTCAGDIKPTYEVIACGDDDTVDIGIVLDWQMIYSIGMSYVSSMANGCNRCDPPDNFMHFILVWNALKLAIDACDYDSLDSLWASLYNSELGRSYVRSGCGCGK